MSLVDVVVVVVDALRLLLFFSVILKDLVEIWLQNKVIGIDESCSLVVGVVFSGEETYLDIVTGREQGRHLAHQALPGTRPGGVDEALRQLHAQLRVEREVMVGSEEIQIDVFHLTRGPILIQGGRGLTIVLKQKL